MRFLLLVCIGVVTLLSGANAKNTYSAFSVGVALPMGSSAPTAYMLDSASGVFIPVSHKDLGTGWDGAWTFFGFPFTKFENAMSGLAFGGKISFSRWVRDSTWTQLYMLGTQGIVRYYVPLKIKPFDLYAQVGGGMSISEHGFNDPDTTFDRANFPTPTRVTEGKKNFGVSFNAGIDWDVIEFTPGITIVLTKGKPSAWLSVSAAAKF